MINIFKTKKENKKTVKSPTKIVVKRDIPKKVSKPLQTKGSAEREAYIQLLNKYEQSNPAKFAAKRDILLAKLKTLK